MDNQMNIPMMAAIHPDIQAAPEHLVSLCDTKADAYRLTMNLSRVKRSDATWAELLGLSRGYLSQILNPRTNSPKYMPPKAEVELVRLAGNTAFCQWVIMSAKGQLNSQKTDAQREAELLQELAAIKARQA